MSTQQTLTLFPLSSYTFTTKAAQPEEDPSVAARLQRWNERGSGGEWEVGDCLAQWWRPAFETFMYPYVPPHITKPKECKKLFLVQMPPTKVLAVPKNMKLLAVPLFELYDNSQR
ncbi:hypothetical protein L7F22_068289 [Adiantum nelumboides]|nr:hypothetical protein [Adiantum nelumboides]